MKDFVYNKKMSLTRFVVCSLFPLTGAGLLTVSCSDFLDKEYDASQSEEKIFSNEQNTRGFLANIYTNLPDGFAPLTDDQWTGASRDAMTDNAVTSWGLHYYTNVANDGYTAADHPLLGQYNVDTYGIRKCNQFMKNARESVVGNGATTDDDNHLYTRYMAEAKLLRALFHFDFICWFGACPIIGDDASGVPIVFDLDNPSAMNMERTPAPEALKWVADQCDEVIKSGALPFRYSNEASNWGRMSGAVAYALKCRALLYRASALNNPSNDPALWQEAAQAADAFITANNASSRPYTLFNTSLNATGDYLGLDPEGLGPIYNGSISNLTLNNEIILARSVWWTNQVEKVFLPVGFTGNFSGAGRTNPTQNFVDCFEMANGMHIDEAGSGYDEQHPYVNRDPRLAQIVFYQNMVWGRNDQQEQRRIDISSNPSAQGIDYSSAMGGTYTGYYLKKFVNNISCKIGATYNHAWPIFRYTEMLLNAAEAWNEAGNSNKALAYINQIRQRAGMPDYTMTDKSELRERIRNERRIELSFEDHRMWDVRRWKLYDGVTRQNELSKPRYQQLLNIYGVTVTGDDVVNAPVFNYGLAETINSRVFNTPKNYLFPLPANEVKRAPNLKQNPGWEVTTSSDDEADDTNAADNTDNETTTEE